MLLRTLALAALVLSAAAPSAPVVPVAIFVTWDGDPTTTVSVDWHLLAGSDVPALELRGPGIAGWRTQANCTVGTWS